MSRTVSIMFQNIRKQKSLSIKIRVGCVGDSITQGTEYPNDLQILLGENYSVGNFGVGGATVTSNSDRPYVNEFAFQRAKQFLPNIVITMLGTNDAYPDFNPDIPNFVYDYGQLITAFQGLISKPKVWIVKPSPVFDDGTGISTENFETYIIPGIEQVASNMNLSIIDVFTPLLNYPKYFFDGVHPNSEGSQEIANIIYNAIMLQMSSNPSPEH